MDYGVTTVNQKIHCKGKEPSYYGYSYETNIAFSSHVFKTWLAYFHIWSVYIFPYLVSWDDSDAEARVMKEVQRNREKEKEKERQRQAAKERDRKTPVTARSGHQGSSEYLTGPANTLYLCLSKSNPNWVFFSMLWILYRKIAKTH